MQVLNKIKEFIVKHVLDDDNNNRNNNDRRNSYYKYVQQISEIPDPIEENVEQLVEYEGRESLKILVLSDSHGWNSAMLEAIELELPDMILHLGDKSEDCECIVEQYPQIPIRTVKGNSDLLRGGLDRDEFVLEGKRFFMTHGHLYGVKMGKDGIINTGLNKGIDILLFGHIHTPFFDEIDGMTILNPGCIGLNQKCYAIIELSNGIFSFNLKNL